MGDQKSEYPEYKLNTGATMPALGFGTFLSAPGEVGSAVKAALQAGYRQIDCAAVYGNQKEIGDVFTEIFNDKNSGIKREDIFITSKLAPFQARPDGEVKQRLQETLKDLQLDYLDLWLIHQPTVVEDDPTYDGKHRIIGKFRPVRNQGWGLQDIWRGMEECQTAGLTKAIGVSNYNAQTLNDCLSYAKIAPAVNQIERHPYLAQPEMLKMCQVNGVIVTGYAPLGAPGLFGGATEVALLQHDTITGLAKKYSKTAAQILIRWAMDTGTVTIPKSVKPSRIGENFTVLDFKLSDEDLAEIAKMDCGKRLFAQDWMGVPAFK